MRILKDAQSSGRLPLDEVALYGAQIHAVLPAGSQQKAELEQILTAENIQVQSLEWIAPTLEDVFISAVKG